MAREDKHFDHATAMRPCHCDHGQFATVLRYVWREMTSQICWCWRPQICRFELCLFYLLGGASTSFGQTMSSVTTSETIFDWSLKLLETDGIRITLSGSFLQNVNMAILINRITIQLRVACPRYGSYYTFHTPSFSSLAKKLRTVVYLNTDRSHPMSQIAHRA